MASTTTQTTETPESSATASAAATEQAATAPAPEVKKDEKEEAHYVVLLPFVGNFTRGDVVSESALGSDPKAMIAEKSIRKALKAEVTAGYVEHPDGVPEEWLKDAAKPKKAAGTNGGTN